MNTLHEPARIGRYTLRNRVVMAPMTRSRADDKSGVPSGLVAQYYAQRADAGLIVTEGTFPSPMGKGYVRTPGIHSAEQIAAWKHVTEAVHAKGGLIFLQLMHTGRISHPSLLPDNATPVAPSAIAAEGKVFTARGPQDFVVPRALETAEVARIVDEFRTATRHALEAGFDGVELHAASGYLPEQFLSSGTNQRTDRYGGSLENRARFILEVLAAMIAEAGSDRVGIKIAPEMGFNSVSDAAPQETYQYLVQRLSLLKLAYLHLVRTKSPFDYRALLRPLFDGPLLHGGGLDQLRAESLMAEGHADAAVFGGLYLANPDLLQRFLTGAPLNTPDRDTLYSEGAKGYTDYPTLGDIQNRALRIHAYGGADAVSLDEIEQREPPSIAPNDVRVRVHAAGINGLDWKIRDGILQDVFRLPLPATLGVELAGEVIETGADVTQFSIGERVMGALNGLGAYADNVTLPADNLAHVPDALSDAQAAAIPVAALTAWQALFEAGELKRGQTVLIQGASGAVGSFAVQFAHRAGARVVATARAANAEYVRELGADEVIDYRTASFWEKVRNVDLVLDLVGGATLSRSWQVLADGGRIVSVAAPDIASQTPAGRRGLWLQMRVDAKRLAEIAQQVASGEFRVNVSEVVALDDAAQAIERNKTGHGPGKAVVKFR
jgi:N-ethylmaleimide reductase